MQAAGVVVMVRPHHFSVNTETPRDNAFQSTVSATENATLSWRAYDEHSAAVAALERHGVRVHVFEGTDPATPDCVFPNNWFSTHVG